MVRAAAFAVLAAALASAVPALAQGEPRHAYGQEMAAAAVEPYGPPAPEASPAQGTVPEEAPRSVAAAEAVPEAAQSPSQEPQQQPAADACGTSEAEAAGYEILSCDPLMVMPLAEWERKSSQPDFYRYEPSSHCFDETSVPGVFEERHGSPETVSELGYDPDWVSSSPLPGGCSFYFHPSQGQGNSAD